MNTLLQKFRLPLSAAFAMILVLTAGCAMMTGMTEMITGRSGSKVTLTGDQEVPPVSTAATGNGTIAVASDQSVSGSITTTGIEGTAAHIHEGAPDRNGPIIVTLTKTSATVWSVPAGAKLTDAQYGSYMAGNLYVNVHSAANKGGEIRGKISPQ